MFTNQIAENIQQVKEEIALEKTDSKYMTDSKINQYQNKTPPSLEKPVFNEIQNIEEGLQTHKQIGNDNFNLIDTADSKSLDQ